MKILCTGISGMQKLRHIESLKPFLHKHKQRVEIFDTWVYLSRAGKDLGQTITKEKVLDLHNLDELRAIAFERICAETERLLKDSPETHIVISTHGCFRWNRTLRSGFDLHYLSRIDPDMYVNLVDDAVKISENLSRDTQWANRLTIDEIVTWRDEEMFITESLAMFQKKPFYLVAIDEVLSSLGNMILFPDRRKIYISFPITAIQLEQPELLNEAAEFAHKLREKYIVFNPLSIKDLHEVDTQQMKVQKHLKAATVWRDFKLISQSDIVAVYYPVEKNSPGVNQEIMYAFTHGKDVYLYYPKKFGMSPFWDPEIAVTQTFDTIEEFQQFFYEMESDGGTSGKK
ncbi:hypothetical protein ACFL6I_14990 [candidate division KSB1 bacterium]